MRWFTIKIRHSSSGYVWADRAGWGPGVYRTWFGALRRALKG